MRKAILYVVYKRVYKTCDIVTIVIRIVIVIQGQKIVIQLVPEIQPHRNDNDLNFLLHGSFRVRRGVVGRLWFRVGVSDSYSFFPD